MGGGKGVSIRRNRKAGTGRKTLVFGVLRFLLKPRAY